MVYGDVSLHRNYRLSKLGRGLESTLFITNFCKGGNQGAGTGEDGLAR